MSTPYPAANLSFRVYENNVNEIATAKLTLPSVSNKIVTLSGSGLAGDLDVPLIGQIDNMELGMDFLSITEPTNYVQMMEPRKHLLTCLVAEEYWMVEDAEADIWAVKHVFIARPHSSNMGTVAPYTRSDASATFTVYRWEGYRDGVQLWLIDKMNMKFVVNGVDYEAKVRKALGYS